jgi:hypothetical protein
MKKMNIPSSKKAERLYKEIRAFRLWADKYYPDRSEENDNCDVIILVEEQLLEYEK